MGHSRAGALHPDCAAFGKLLDLSAPPRETEEHAHETPACAKPWSACPFISLTCRHILRAGARLPLCPDACGHHFL